MMGSKKQLVAEIAVTVKKLQTYQAELLEHEHYFKKILNDNRLVILATLLPAFVIGWRSGRAGHIGGLAKLLLKAEVLTAIAQFKK